MTLSENNTVLKCPYFVNNYTEYCQSDNIIKLYNYGGQGVWKLTGAIEHMTINGKDYIDRATLDKTLYSSPYMVVTEREYTKHYFVESERITSKIGGGFKYRPMDPLNDHMPPIITDYKVIATNLFDNMVYSEGRSIAQCSDGIEIELNPSFKYFRDILGVDKVEAEQYFYHSDRLQCQKLM